MYYSLDPLFKVKKWLKPIFKQDFVVKVVKHVTKEHLFPIEKHVQTGFRIANTTCRRKSNSVKNAFPVWPQNYFIYTFGIFV